MKQKQQSKRSNKSSIWLLAGAIVIFAAVAWVSLRTTDQPATDSPSAETARSQDASASKYATLSPSMFTGRAREAYQAAKDVPEVLKQVQCYCGCKRSAGHQSNYDCFTDEHGFG